MMKPLLNQIWWNFWQSIKKEIMYNFVKVKVALNPMDRIPCTPIMGRVFDTMIVVFTDKEWL